MLHNLNLDSTKRQYQNTSGEHLLEDGTSANHRHISSMEIMHANKTNVNFSLPKLNNVKKDQETQDNNVLMNNSAENFNINMNSTVNNEVEIDPNQPKM